eukprot:1157758-Pelagomonas_calceolata.AAC.4
MAQILRQAKDSSKWSPAAHHGLCKPQVKKLRLSRGWCSMHQIMIIQLSFLLMQPSPAGCVPAACCTPCWQSIALWGP